MSASYSVSIRSLLDPKEWGSGPWLREPVGPFLWDRGEYQCCVVRGPSGGWNGYVGIPANHSYWNVGIDVPDVMVHGGITYSDPDLPYQRVDDSEDRFLIPGASPYLWWLGFDTGHHDDFMPRHEAEMRVIRGLIHDPFLGDLPGLPAQLRRMLTTKKCYKTFEWVVKETDHMQRQLERIP